MKASTRHSVATKRFLALGIAACACAAASLGELPPQMRFDLDPPPATFPADAYRTNGVETVFYESIPFKGRPTRVFAYYGVPKSADGRKVPGMVLIHGGGGSAFYRWVKFWNDKGYAAISMDTCGCVSGNVIGNEQRAHFRHEWGGPAGWGGFNTLDAPVEDQWCRHAMAAVIRGHSLLRSLMLDQILRVTLILYRLHPRIIILHQIPQPERSSRFQGTVYFPHDSIPLLT